MEVENKNPKADIKKSSGLRKHSETLTEATQVCRVAHNLGTTDIVISVFDLKTGNEVMPDRGYDICCPTAVILHFSVAIEPNRYRVVIVG